MTIHSWAGFVEPIAMTPFQHALHRLGRSICGQPVCPGDPGGPPCGERAEGRRERVLEMIAQNEPLEAILDQIAGLAEAQCPEARALMLLLREGRLRLGCAPRLPEEFTRLMDGLPAGSAGLGPLWGKEPLASDIAADRRWEAHREAALESGLRGCWSHPILAATGEVLGTLALFHGSFREPSAAEREALESISRLAGIAIEQRHLIEELTYKAHHDSLTRLSNRILFEERLQQAIQLAQRGGFAVGLLHIDLDRFKAVNDLLGHHTGDALLASVARRLEDSIRRTDTLARTGGDEFTLLVPAVDGPEGAQAVARKVLEALGEPFLVEGREVFISASIGVSLFPADAASAEALERNAADAMERAKSQGKSHYQMFRQEMSTASRERLELETGLHGALERGEFSLHYQPQVDVRSGAIAGVEALLRWKHPALGMVSPAQFIPVAEDTGLIVPIGEWVLEQACLQGAHWRQAGVRVKIAVNVSAVQFARTDLVETVARALSRSATEPSQLELELTESTIMQDVQQAAWQMDRLRQLGISLAIDDFGTGYSSLAYLQRLPIDVLKIDQAFVREIQWSSDKPALVKTIIGLARTLGKRVVAEGVEAPEHLEALAGMGCDLAQGFLLARPMPPEQFLDWLAAREARKMCAAAG